MTTTSYPVEGLNLTSDQWSKLLQRQHQGIDTGMTLSLSSTTNDATISSGRCNFLGFELEVTSAHVVTLPASTGSPITYVVGVVFNPANVGTAGGPLSISSGVKGAVTIPAGGALWPIWEITRFPSTTLNNSAVAASRTIRTSLVTATSSDVDPNPASVQGGMLVVRPSGFRLLSGGVWRDVKDDTGDQNTGTVEGPGWGYNGTVWSTLNGVTFVDVKSYRTGGTFSGNATGSLTDMVVTTLPAAARPKRMWVGGGSLTLATGPTMGCDVRIYANGQVVLTSVAPNLGVPMGSDFYASAAYRS